MASKVPKKLIDIQGKLNRFYIRVGKFMKHKLFSQRRNALIISPPNALPIFQELLLKKFSRTWTVNLLQIRDSGQFLLVEQKNQQVSTSVEDNNVIQSKDQKNFIQNTYKANVSNLESLLHIQQFYKGKHFDSIIVLPQKQHLSEPNDFASENFLTSFYPQKDIIPNIIAYRLAHKYLSTSGVIILSTSEEDFIKQQKKKSNQKQGDTQTVEKQAPQVVATSMRKSLLEAQNIYLGTIIGDRDYTDLNSWSVIGLSNEASASDPEFVSQAYRNWAQVVRIPMPGSFALFKRLEQNKNKCSYIQYL